MADDMEFFQGCSIGESFGEAITRFRASGLMMTLARMATGGILVPTKSLMRHIEVEKFDTVEEEEACVEDCRVMYDCLYHRDGNFNADYGDMSVEDTLRLWRVSYVSHSCLSRAAKWCSSVTVVTLL
jgi:hypothetical protein